MMLSAISNDNRPFVLSTPRLETPDSLHLQRAFDDPVVDQLFRMKLTPLTWHEIKDTLQLQLPDPKDELLRSFFTSEAPPPYSRVCRAGRTLEVFRTPLHSH